MKRERVVGMSIAALVVALLLVVSMLPMYLQNNPARAYESGIDTLPLGDRVPGEVNIRLRNGAGDKDAERLFARHGYKRSDWHRAVHFVPAYTLCFSEEERDIKEVLREFIRDDEVLYASPNGIATLDWHPNDPEFEGSEGIQWNLLNRWDEKGYPGSIGAKRAWDYQKGNKDVIVAVVDTGVNIGHEDLGWINNGPIWTNDDPVDDLDTDGNGFVDDTHGWNFFDNNDNLTDDIGHGTQVAGIIGARTNNGIGIAAVCPNVTIMPIKVYGREELDTGDATIANGVYYAVKNGADIINMSLSDSNPDNMRVTCEAVQRAYDNGCVVVASSGNDNKGYIYCPADRPGAIAVGASDFFGGRCKDMPWGSNHGPGLDLMAPGTGVKSTGPGGGYEPFEGTSAAAPHVSGVAALILSQEIPYAKDRIKHYLNKTAYKNPDTEVYNSGECGNGVLDAEKALDLVVNPPDFISQCEWYFPEGTTRPGFEEWICVQNPNGHDAEICLELMTPTSSTFDEVRIVPKYSRTSIRINDILTGDVSVRLLSDSKVYAERSLYWADRREGHTCHGLKHDPLKPSSTWYMAEGATGTTNEFQTFVLVQNPNDQEVTITAEFQLGPEQGEVDDYPLTLPARSRGTIWLNKAPGMPGRADVSTKVTCNEGLGILAERSTYWNIPDEAPGIPGKPSDAYGGHCSPGVTSGNTEWYLAEGSTNWGFDTYVLIQNPNNKEATVNVTYMKSSGAKIIKRLTIAAKSRKTIHLNDHDQTPDSDVSTMVESSPASPSNPPVVAERAMYWDSDPETGILGPGHSSEGVPVAAKKWYLAEGSTDWGFDTYVLIQNPNEKEATVNVTYMTPSGENIMEPFIMPANSRKTIHLNDPEQAPNSDVSTLITADVRVVAERAMYWINTEGLKGGTDSVGMPEIPVWDTQTGNDVWVILSEGEVTFEEVSSHGTTVIVEGSEHRSDGPPLGYLRVCEGTYYHLATTAEHSGNIDIELNYFGLPDGVPTEYIRLLFYNEDTGTWSDITTGVDPERKVVKGTSGSTGIFCVAVPVTVEVHPETLNLNSQGRWITTYIGLPEGYDAGGIDVETVQLRYGEHVIDAQWGNVEEDGRLMVKFDRQAVSAILPVADEVELFISGEFHGVLFRASDHIRVISPGK